MGKESRGSDARMYGDYRRAIQAKEAPPTGPLRLLASLALLFSALVVAGSFAPWMHVPDEVARRTIMVRGVQTDGVFTLITGTTAVVAFTVALIRPWNHPAALIGLIASGFSVVGGSLSWLFTNQSIDEYDAIGEPARLDWGLPFVVVAAIAATIYAWMHHRATVDS